jgi:large-conductance mechanosensitive channel
MPSRARHARVSLLRAVLSLCCVFPQAPWCGTMSAQCEVWVMDDTPRHFVEELRSSLLKRRAGQIAIAVILAEACLRFLNALTWFVVVPVIANMLNGHTESVLFENRRAFPWEQLTGAALDFAVALIFVFYLNRWIHGKANQVEPQATATPVQDPSEEQGSEAIEIQEQPPDVIYNLVGEPVVSDKE